MPSLGVVANVYNEIHALPGWLEMACGGYFDDVRILHAGPRGRYSTDGTIELVEKWGVPIIYTAIDAGFGSVRTQALHACKTDFVMILDADERFRPLQRLLHCEGTDRYPEQPEPALRVIQNDVWVDAGAKLKQELAEAEDGVAFCRRHFFDLTNTRPCENWTLIHDWQLRCLRNAPHVGYRPERKMHEQAINLETGGLLRYRELPWPTGVTLDHYHLFFKGMEPSQRAHDIRIYDSLDRGEEVPVA